MAVVVFVLLATGGRPWGVFARGPFTSDFYDVQARAISRGRLDVPAEIAGIEGFPMDDGTHFYFGLAPALARLPISAATDALDGRLVSVSMTAGLVVACLAAARLLQRAGAALDVPKAGWSWITGGFAASVGVATPLLWLSSGALVYHEAEMWGAALALVGFDRIIVWWTTRRPVDLVWASVAASLAWSTRGSSGTGPALALGALAVVLGVRRHWRVAAWTLLSAAVPLVLYASVNLARFGTFVSIPLERQVTTEFSAARRAALADNGGSLFGVAFIPSTARQYLRPDTLATSALLPWFSWAPRAEPVGDVTFDTIDRSASLPATAPVFVAAGAIGAGVVLRRRVTAAWSMSLVGAAASVLPTLSIAFIAHRYLADFVPVVVLSAAVGVAAAVAWAQRALFRRRLVAASAIVLISAGVIVNIGLTLLSRNIYGLSDPDARRSFVALQYAVHDALGGDAPPAVTVMTTLGPAGSDGDIAILGDCDGVFRSDGDGWRLLELRAGGAQRLVLDGEDAGTVVTGRDWQIDLEDGAGGRRLVYRGPADAMVAGAAIGEPGPLRVDIAADTEIPNIVATIDGVTVLEAFLQPAEGPLVPGQGWSSIAGDAELCNDLRARME